MRYDVFSKFGLHLIHGHFPLAQDKVMLGTYVPELTGYWTKPTEINTVNLADVHGHIFVVAGKNSFIAYEYREGPTVDLSDIKPEFFHDVVEYLQANGLQDVLGLQVLTADCSEKMAEFDLGAGAGTIMLKDSDAKYGRVYRVTGWVFEERDGIVSCKGNDVHAGTTKGPHKVFQDSKLLRNVHELTKALKEEEIVA